MACRRISVTHAQLNVHVDVDVNLMHGNPCIEAVDAGMERKSLTKCISSNMLLLISATFSRGPHRNHTISARLRLTPSLSPPSSARNWVDMAWAAAPMSDGIRMLTSN